MLSIIYSWFISHGIKIICILIAVYLTKHFGGVFIGKVIKKSIKKTYRIKDGKAQEKREKTLTKVFSSVLGIMAWVMAILMILSEFGIDIGPLLAGAGIAGIAFGFGAQHMVRDFLAGLFIILEDQYRIGDVICLDGTCGGVEEINLRKTILRDLDGIQHTIPNGEIKKASNLSKGFSRINLNIGIAYKENLERVIKVLNKVGKEMAKDPKWKEDITKTPQVLGVNDFADSAVIIKILGETKPLRQWDATRELRKRIKIAFDKEEIEIPFPQMSIWPRGKWDKH